MATTYPAYNPLQRELERGSREWVQDVQFRHKAYVTLDYTRGCFVVKYPSSGSYQVVPLEAKGMWEARVEAAIYLDWLLDNGTAEEWGDD